MVTVEIAVAMEDTVADMPRPATLGADMPAMSKLDTLFAVGVATIMRGVGAETRAMPDAHLPGGAAVTGEAAVIGEVITDIPGLAITARAMAIRITDMAITVTATVGTMVRTTTDITLTATDIGRP